MNDHAASPAPAPERTTAPQETEVWWGSYSGWTMLPSLFLCIALTGVIILGAWLLVEPRHRQWVIWGLAGAMWFIQVVRWGRRVFGHNYRLTTRHLFIMRGHFFSRRLAISLSAGLEVKVQRTAWTRLTNVGRIVVFAGQRKPIAVLEGVRDADKVAARIRKWCT